MYWTSTMLELVPQYCIKCENRIKSITPQKYLMRDLTVVRCGHCGYILYSLHGA
jgi:predicted  nucleic acid-binding Zn-ribbon protein